MLLFIQDYRPPDNPFPTHCSSSAIAAHGAHPCPDSRSSRASVLLQRTSNLNMHSSMFFLVTLIASNLSGGLATPLDKRMEASLPQCPSGALVCCKSARYDNQFKPTIGEECTYPASLLHPATDSSVPTGTNIATVEQRKACRGYSLCCTEIVSSLSVVWSSVSAHSDTPPDVFMHQRFPLLLSGNFLRSLIDGQSIHGWNFSREQLRVARQVCWGFGSCTLPSELLSCCLPA